MEEIQNHEEKSAEKYHSRLVIGLQNRHLILMTAKIEVVIYNPILAQDLQHQDS
jgi:hypothetical protein